MSKVEDVVCYLTDCVFKFWFERKQFLIKNIWMEKAYKNAHKTLSDAGIVSAKIVNDDLTLYVLDPSVMYMMNKYCEPELWTYICNKINKKFNLNIKIVQFNINNKDLGSVMVYECTKSYLELSYDMVMNGVLSWETAFNLED